MRNFKKRRFRDKNPPFTEQGGQKTVKEREKQCADLEAVFIGINDY